MLLLDKLEGKNCSKTVGGGGEMKKEGSDFLQEGRIKYLLCWGIAFLAILGSGGCDRQTSKEAKVGIAQGGEKLKRARELSQYR